MIQRFFRAGLCIAIQLLIIMQANAQVNWITPDHVYMDNIKTVHLNLVGSPLSYPIIKLNSSDQLQLSFDDLDADVKNYFYTIELCNADWTPTDLSPFDYIKGFSENSITNYTYSTIPLQHYTHYSLVFPNSNCSPTRSGNYILKVYLNSDTSQLAFTRRFLVLDNKVVINGKIQQPIDPKIFKTYQKVNFSINTQGLNISSAMSQIKVYILQNYRWDNAISNIQPTFIKQNELDYNTENDCIFPAMKEWRFLDLRSFRLEGERVKSIQTDKNGTEVYVLPDYNRANIQYQPRRDINGMYTTELLETDYNPAYEADYATVHFTFLAPTPFGGSSLYIFGALTNYECNDSNKLTYHPEDGAYEGTLYLKQGYYNYVYGTIEKGSNSLNTNYTEGNWWQTENDYTILVYYRDLGGRADQLVGSITLNSITNHQ
jgi:Type 9 secretion system plug protein 1st domain